MKKEIIDAASVLVYTQKAESSRMRANQWYPNSIDADCAYRAGDDAALLARLRSPRSFDANQLREMNDRDDVQVVKPIRD